MDLLPVPPVAHGMFYTGDTYVVLHSEWVFTESGAKHLSWNLHSWLGSDAEQDKLFVAAFKVVELARHMEGSGKQHREVQGEESDEFLS